MISDPRINEPLLNNGLLSFIWGQWFQSVFDTIKGMSGILSSTVTLDFPAIASANMQELSVTVTGVSVNDTVSLGLPATVSLGVLFDARVTTANTVTVRATNITSSSVNPASATYRVTVITH